MNRRPKPDDKANPHYPLDGASLIPTLTKGAADYLWLYWRVALSWLVAQQFLRERDRFRRRRDHFFCYFFECCA